MHVWEVHLRPVGSLTDLVLEDDQSPHRRRPIPPIHEERGIIFSSEEKAFADILEKEFRRNQH